MASKHYHFTVVANNGLQKNKIHFIDGVSISLIGFQGEREAQERAKQLITRKHYSILSMFECNTCRIQEEVSSSLKKMTDHE